MDLRPFLATSSQPLGNMKVKGEQEPERDLSPAAEALRIPHGVALPFSRELQGSPGILQWELVGSGENPCAGLRVP